MIQSQNKYCISPLNSLHRVASILSEWRNAKMSDAVNIYEKIFHLSLRNFNVGRHTYHLILIKIWPKYCFLKSCRSEIRYSAKTNFDSILMQFQ